MIFFYITGLRYLKSVIMPISLPSWSQVFSVLNTINFLQKGLRSSLFCMFSNLPILFGSVMFTTGHRLLFLFYFVLFFLNVQSLSMHLRAGNYNSINAAKIKWGCWPPHHTLGMYSTWYLTKISQIFFMWTTAVKPYFLKMLAINLQGFHLHSSIHAFDIHCAFKWWLCFWFKCNYPETEGGLNDCLW